MDWVLAKMMALFAVCLLFPLGIWLGLEGYEILALICLILGWCPVGAVVLEWFFLDRYR